MIMSIGLGIVLLLLGLILLLDVVNVDLPLVEDYQLGILLAILGLVALVLSMVLGTSRRGATHVVEREREVP
jgi:cell division protein FtsW (lipid II flippase)